MKMFDRALAIPALRRRTHNQLSARKVLSASMSPSALFRLRLSAR
jgi:hypothetical protein